MSISLRHKHTGPTNAFYLFFSLTAKELGFNNDWLLWQMTFSKHLVVALTHTTPSLQSCGNKCHSINKMQGPDLLNILR